MRPRTPQDVLGIPSALQPGTPLRRLLDGTVSDVVAAPSVILVGPPGSGKTTIAALMANTPGRRFVAVSATDASVATVRAEIAQARTAAADTGQSTVLFIDEVHRFSKSQQDALLPAVENGDIILVAATTENPAFAIISALLSRSLVVTLTRLSDDNIAVLLERATTDSQGLEGRWTLSDDALVALVRLACGDARKALTLLESAAAVADAEPGITAAHVQAAASSVVPVYDRDADNHYDLASALIKSIRGSDADAAVYWLARMLASGEDPRFVARRLVISASEDVGLADPAALWTASAAASAVAMVGMPEARIILAQAVLHLALAPKSNSVYRAIDAATADIGAGLVVSVPDHLRDRHSTAPGSGRGYRYPHDDPAGVVRQTYVDPAVAAKRYFRPSARGKELDLSGRWEKLRRLVRGR